MRRTITAMLLCLIMLLTGCAKTDSIPEEEIIITSANESTEKKPSVIDKNLRKSEIVEVDYETSNYETMEKVTKRMSIYIPAGYSPEERYNVAIALHVLGADEDFWPEHGVKEIMDNLIDSGVIEPTLVFMPNNCLEKDTIVCENEDDIYFQFTNELRNDIVPYIKNTFYVSDNRDDYACIGASLGAYVTVNSALCTNLDLFSNFASIGGGVISHWKLDSDWEEYGTEDLDVNMLYIGQGVADNKDPIEQGCKNLKAESEKFTDDNLVFSLIKHAGHDDLEWTTGFKEAMILFFGKETVNDNMGVLSGI